MEDLLTSLIYNVFKDFVIQGIAVTVSIIALVRTKANVPNYAIIGKDGEILSRRDFKQYGLFVEKRMIDLEEGDEQPAYFLSFEKEPEYFEITTREAAVAEIKQVDINKYQVRFVHSGFGAPIIECNFKIQAY